MTNILVTGGAGYVGSHICKYLSQTGHTPIAVDNLSTGHKELVKWGPLEVGEINNLNFIEKIIAEHKPEGVVHCAALATVSTCNALPEQAHRINVMGTFNLIQAMKRKGVDNLVFTSTASTGQNAYTRSKQSAEAIIRQCGLNHAILKLHNVAGADGETGEWHEPETHVIPLAIEAALKDIPFNLYGTDYDTPDGTAVRDYVHVLDVSRLVSISLASMLKGDGYQIIEEIGTGRGHSVMEVLKAVEHVTGKTISYQEKARRDGDIASLVSPFIDEEARRLATIIKDAVTWARR